ncbi:hypothetical protein PXO_04758 [Xanthomonas oryzae pv. oryzae PXO99A]|uniref:Uncharacterized protein n=1 Tax=Xanthomonas oryzae pv. oryzae (strain PXO99A) TaxID=360094 RepID=A0A0K0GIB4_XANOP|nr:hypothetical protein PXO_04758 [Xanthomonas oryzae pv. oryzae PXO99A]
MWPGAERLTKRQAPFDALVFDSGYRPAADFFRPRMRGHALENSMKLSKFARCRLR